MRHDLFVGFPVENLHGGVTSSSLAADGGLTKFVDLLDKNLFRSFDETDYFSGLVTGNCWIEYLKVGLGRSFFSANFILRSESRL
jgi:hypothetical protein